MSSNNNYTKVLTFFLEHHIQLTENQLKELKKDFEILNETRYIYQDLDGFAHKHGVDTTSNAMIPLRKVDLAYRKYLRGDISENEYESRVKEIESNYKKIINNKNIRALFDDFSKIENRKAYTKSIGNSLSPEEYGKLERHINIAQSTNNKHEYKDSHARINKLVGKDKQNAIGFEDNNKTIISVAPGKTIDNRVMYHTSKQDDIDELKGEYRSSGRMLYPDDRVYVSSDPMDKGGGTNKNILKKKAIYQIDPDPNTKLKADNEFPNKGSNKSAYIEKEKVKAKQIKRKGEDYNK